MSRRVFVVADNYDNQQGSSGEHFGGSNSLLPNPRPPENCTGGFDDLTPLSMLALQQHEQGMRDMASEELPTATFNMGGHDISDAYHQSGEWSENGGQAHHDSLGYGHGQQAEVQEDGMVHLNGHDESVAVPGAHPKMENGYHAPAQMVNVAVAPSPSSPVLVAQSSFHNETTAESSDGAQTEFPHVPPKSLRMLSSPVHSHSSVTSRAADAQGESTRTNINGPPAFPKFILQSVSKSGAGSARSSNSGRADNRTSDSSSTCVFCFVVNGIFCFE